MVFIITKIRYKKATIVFLPKQPMATFLDSHVDRRGIGGQQKTCLVSSSNNWTGKPSHQQIISMLEHSLLSHAITGGENDKYPIPHSLFQHIKCRFFKDTIPDSLVFEGNFVINFIKVDIRKRSVVELLKSFEKVDGAEEKRIRKAISDCSGFESVIVYIARHIHPARSN